MRQLIVQRAVQGWPYQQIATALGISVRTVAKWVARGHQRGHSTKRTIDEGRRSSGKQPEDPVQEVAYLPDDVEEACVFKKLHEGAL